MKWDDTCVNAWYLTSDLKRETQRDLMTNAKKNAFNRDPNLSPHLHNSICGLAPRCFSPPSRCLQAGSNRGTPGVGKKSQGDGVQPHLTSEGGKGLSKPHHIVRVWGWGWSRGILKTCHQQLALLAHSLTSFSLSMPNSTWGLLNAVLSMRLFHPCPNWLLREPPLGFLFQVSSCTPFGSKSSRRVWGERMDSFQHPVRGPFHGHRAGREY